MEKVNDIIINETCRFCQQYDSSLPGCKVCNCDNNCGYGHLRCFYSFVQQTGRRKCEYCKCEWMVDKQTWKRFIVQVRRVYIVNRIREAASLLLTILTLLAMILLWAYVVKVFVWIITGRPTYAVFGQSILISNGWTQPTLGDLVTGLLATLISIGIVFLWIHFKPRCYRHCCMTNNLIKYQIPGYPNPNDDFIPIDASTKDEHALDTIVSRQINRQRSKGIKHTQSESSVALQGLSTDEDVDSDSLSFETKE